ncbi:MAG: hypothetical protein FWB72_04620 [Firmicutes bacterium]|nr:hypothetical protein [Bacillota bacterium]
MGEKTYKSIKRADILLMVPGFFNSKFPRGIKHEIGNFLNYKIQVAAENEFAGDELKNNHRETLGVATIFYKDLSGNINPTKQEIVINILINKESNYCVLELYIPEIKICTHEVLDWYCGNMLLLNISGRTLSLNEYIESIGMSAYGDRRSLVFVNNEPVCDESLYNLLVNEARPMGAIMGEHFKKLALRNLAQYDTARVYASERTMVELVKNPPIDLKERIATQALEVFFVEMLLLQDAAISRIYSRVKKLAKEERRKPFSKKTKMEMDELLSEMIFVYEFANYKQFHYPTVRVSAENVAKALGVAAIQNKVVQSKSLIKQTMDNNARKLEKRENSIKNILLIALTLISGANTIATVINIMFDDVSLRYAYYIAFFATAVAAVIFLFVLRIFVKFGGRSGRIRKRSNY